jgi:hypothetical protein
LDLSPAHHLLFQVIEIDEKKKGGEDKEKVLAFAWTHLVDADGT